MTPDPQPFAGIRLLLIDGNNLLHRLSGGADASSLRQLLPRLRATVPPGLQTIVVLDGQPGPGALLRTPAAPGIEFRHSGRVDADTALLEILVARPFAERRATVVVSDDRALRDRVRHGGGTAQRLDWLRALMDRGPASPSPSAGPSGSGPGTGIGRPSVPRPMQPRRDARPRDEGSDAADDDERRPWTPGRGATRKRGNSRKGRS